MAPKNPLYTARNVRNDPDLRELANEYDPFFDTLIAYIWHILYHLTPHSLNPYVKRICTLLDFGIMIGEARSFNGHRYALGVNYPPKGDDRGYASGPRGLPPINTLLFAIKSLSELTSQSLLPNVVTIFENENLMGYVEKAKDECATKVEYDVSGKPNRFGYLFARMAYVTLHIVDWSLKILTSAEEKGRRPHFPPDYTWHNWHENVRKGQLEAQIAAIKLRKRTNPTVPIPFNPSLKDKSLPSLENELLSLTGTLNTVQELIKQSTGVATSIIDIDKKHYSWGIISDYALMANKAGMRAFREDLEAYLYNRGLIDNPPPNVALSGLSEEQKKQRRKAIDAERGRRNSDRVSVFSKEYYEDPTKGTFEHSLTLPDEEKAPTKASMVRNKRTKGTTVAIRSGRRTKRSEGSTSYQKAAPSGTNSAATDTSKSSMHK